MVKAATHSGNRKSDANRSWGLTVLKTAYRDTYPKVSAEIILRNAQTLEQTMFENSNSKEGYDDSVSKAADSIIRGFETNTNEELSRPGGNEIINAGRTPSSKAHSIRSGDITQRPRGLEELYFSGTQLDSSDVMRLVPFILEAGFHVTGRIETAEQARGITESQKSCITFLAMEKMSRAPQFAAKPERASTPFPELEKQSLGVYEQDQVTFRARNLQNEYMCDIRTIYAKLGEKFDDPECDQRMLSNISCALKKLEELGEGSYNVSKDTIPVLSYVENVFSTAIEHYGHLVKDGKVTSNGFKASNNSVVYHDAGALSAVGPVSGSHGPGIVDWGNHRSHYQERVSTFSNRDELLSHHMLKARYCDTINTLNPLINVELGKHPVAEEDDTCEKLAYALAFLKLDNVTEKEVLQSAENVMEDLCKRFGYLLRGSRMASKVENAKVAGWNSQSLREMHDWKQMSPQSFVRANPARLSRMTAPTQMRHEGDDFDENNVLVQNGDDDYVGSNEEPEAEAGEESFVVEFAEENVVINLGETRENDDDRASALREDETSIGPRNNLSAPSNEREEDSVTNHKAEAEEAVRNEGVNPEPEIVAVREELEDQVSEAETASQPIIVEKFTPRRSRRNAVAAAGADKNATPSRSTTAPGRSTRTPRRSVKTPGKTRSTPGRVLRTRKTPLKE